MRVSRLQTATRSRQNPRESSMKASSMDQEEKSKDVALTMPAELSRLQSDKEEPKHPGAAAQQARGSMTGLSFYEKLLLGPSSTSNEGVAFGGSSGTVNDTSLAVARPASEPSEVQLQHGSDTMSGNETLLLQEQQADMPPRGSMSSTPANTHELVLDGVIQAHQQTCTVTPEQQLAIDTTAGKIDDTKEGKVDNTKAGKLDSVSINTLQDMPNRNICVPLDPVPSVCSSTLKDAQSVSLPGFQQLVNYDYCRQVSKDGNKMCVMCGVSCQYLRLKRDLKNNLPFILHVNKGICSVCRDIVWLVVDSKLEIRFCYHCQAFHPWAAFQKDDGRMAKQCNSCRCRNTARAGKKRASLGKETATNAIVPATTSAYRCVILPPPVKLPPQSTLELTDDIPLPSLDRIVNYPALLRKLPDKNGNKCCVMCSKSLPYLLRSQQSGPEHRIPVDNKGVCTVCEEAVWQLVEKGEAQIKWCNGCRHFRPLAAYRGHENQVTKTCSHCRLRSNAKREKKRSSSVPPAGGVVTAVAPAVIGHVVEG